MDIRGARGEGEKRGVSAERDGCTCNNDAMSEQAPAGWYPDGQGNERYWDGSAWTAHVRAHESPAAATPDAGAKSGAFSKLGAAVRKASAEKQAKKDELAREQAEYAAAAGQLVTSGVFGASTVEIYENGYVRVAAGTEDHSAAVSIGKTTPFEKLSSIRFTDSDAEKEAAAPPAPAALAGTVGTAVTTLMSGGKNLLKGTVPGLAVAGVSHLATTASRRSVLTIVTNKTIHTLSNQYKNSIGIKTSNKGHGEVARALEAAGHAALGVSPVQVAEEEAPSAAQSVAETVVAEQSSPGPSLAERLRELAMLHAEGILSDQEYTESKARLLATL